MTPPIIEVKDLTKRYKNATSNAVDGISFNVAPGEFFALLGIPVDGWQVFYSLNAGFLIE